MDAYDELAYDSLCIPETHPTSLSALAYLFGSACSSATFCCTRKPPPNAAMTPHLADFQTVMWFYEAHLLGQHRSTAVSRIGEGRAGLAEVLGRGYYAPALRKN